MTHHLIALIFCRYITTNGYRYNMSSGEFLFWFCLPIIVVIFCTIYFYLQHYEIKIGRLKQYLKPLTPPELALLKGFKYYDALAPLHQTKFEKRVRHFLINKKFVAKDFSEPTNEMKILIAAACVQLTFGHRPYYLARFSTVSIYLWKSIRSDEIRTKNELIINWSEFHEGYSSVKDGYNPGMEMLAVALLLEENLRKTTDKLFHDHAYRNWRIQSKIVAERFIKSGLTPFRNYQEVDKEKFFAVAVVYFFEKPAEFQLRFPELFKAMKKLMRQDPLKFKYKS